MPKKDFIVRGILDNDAFFPMLIDDEMYNSITNYVYSNLVANSSSRRILATAPLKDIQNKKTSDLVTAINIYLEYLDNKEDINKQIHDDVFDGLTKENNDIELFDQENNLIRKYYEDNIQESVSIIEEYFQNKSIRSISEEQLINEKDKISADNIKQENLFSMYNFFSTTEFENELKRLFKEAYLQIFDETNWNSSNFDSNRRIRNVLISTGLTPIVSGGPDNFIGKILMEIRHNLISKIIRTRHDEKTDVLYKMYIIQYLLHYDLSRANPIQDTWINNTELKSLDDIISMFKTQYSDELFNKLSREIITREMFVNQLKQNKIDRVIIDNYDFAWNISVHEFILKLVNEFYSNKRERYIEQATQDIIFDEYLKDKINQSGHLENDDLDYKYERELNIQKSKKSHADLENIKKRVLAVYENKKFSAELIEKIRLKISILEQNYEFRNAKPTQKSEVQLEIDAISKSFREFGGGAAAMTKNKKGVFSEEDKHELRSYFRQANLLAIFEPIIIALDTAETAFHLPIPRNYVIDITSNQAFAFLVETDHSTSITYKTVNYPTILHYVYINYLLTLLTINTNKKIPPINQSDILALSIEDLQKLFNKVRDEHTKTSITKFLVKAISQKFSDMGTASQLKAVKHRLKVEPKNRREPENSHLDVFIASKTENILNSLKDRLPSGLSKFKPKLVTNSRFYKWVLSESEKILKASNFLNENYYELDPLALSKNKKNELSNSEKYTLLLDSFLKYIYKPGISCEETKEELKEIMNLRIPKYVSGFFYDYFESKFELESKIEIATKKYQEEKKQFGASGNVGKTKEEIEEYDEEADFFKREQLWELIMTPKKRLEEEIQEVIQKFKDKETKLLEKIAKAENIKFEDVLKFIKKQKKDMNEDPEIQNIKSKINKLERELKKSSTPGDTQQQIKVFLNKNRERLAKMYESYPANFSTLRDENNSKIERYNEKLELLRDTFQSEEVDFENQIAVLFKQFKSEKSEKSKVESLEWEIYSAKSDEKKQKLKNELIQLLENEKLAIDYRAEFDRLEFLEQYHYVDPNAPQYMWLTKDQRKINSNNKNKSQKTDKSKKDVLSEIKKNYKSVVNNIKTFKQSFDHIIYQFVKKLFCVYKKIEKQKSKNVSSAETDEDLIEGIARINLELDFDSEIDDPEIVSEIVSGLVSEIVKILHSETNEFEEESEKEEEFQDIDEELEDREVDPNQEDRDDPDENKSDYGDLPELQTDEDE